MFPVNVSPDMAMYNLLKNQGYETSYALAEFIDNAIHAWQQTTGKKKPLEVVVKFYSMDYKKDLNKRNSIEVADTGPGIPKNQIANAFKPAKKPISKGLSEFGIGMKTASVWFADEWQLVTRPINDTNKYRFKFSLENLLKSGSDTVNVEEKINDDKIFGTTVFLRNLRKPINKIKFNEICNDLREFYQVFSSKEKTLSLSAEYDDTPIDLSFSPPDRSVLTVPVHKVIKGELYAIGSKRIWLEKLSFKFKGCNVHGHIQLLETGSYTSNPGLVLFRHNRVITGITRLPYIPEKLFGTANKYGKQRIYGELHLDDLPVSYTKDKFEFDEDEFISLIKSNTSVAELLRQSSDYRVKGTPKIIAAESDLKSDGTKTDKTCTEKKKGSRSSKKTDEGGKNKNSESSHADDTKNTANVTSFSSILQSLNTKNLALQDVITETTEQYTIDRSISSALCLRIVLETGVLCKIERDFPTEYSKVSDKSIGALINYIHSNSSTFFDKPEHRTKKCVQSLITGTQLNVIFINNVAHGHYHPSIDELDKLIANLQPLLEWAYA